ncbi:MAG: Dihydroorotate oxidase [Parcubacteria group bacterium GW2011_GWA2_51_10]|nr:MAG: Dihydroorotate oxidase [Parcubacteria group bacterium GW2011_GWA2_51_10]
MLNAPFFDPNKTYHENWEEGPFNGFADGVVLPAGEPRFDFLGQKISYPLGIPAGPLLNGKFVKAALDKGFDVPVHKTVRSKKHPCNEWPNVLGAEIEGDLTIERAQKSIIVRNEYKEPLSITNSFGNPSYDPDVWVADLKDAARYAKPGQFVMCSFEGTKREGMTSEGYINDWADGMQMLKDAGVKVVEANFSCPNEGAAQLLCFDTPKVKLVADAIKNKIGDTPLVIKIAYFDEPSLRELVKETGNIVDGYGAINTIPAPVMSPDGTQALPGAHRVKSGICGAAIKWAGLDMTRRLKALRKELGFTYAIIGSGGVTVPSDFKEYRDAGADVVMTATGAMWNPYLAKEIKEQYPDA